MVLQGGDQGHSTCGFAHDNGLWTAMQQQLAYQMVKAWLLADDTACRLLTMSVALLMHASSRRQGRHVCAGNHLQQRHHACQQNPRRVRLASDLRLSLGKIAPTSYHTHACRTVLHSAHRQAGDCYASEKISQRYKYLVTSCVADACPSALHVQNGINSFHLKMPELLVMLLSSCK